jgi:chromosome segregation ATPase
MNTFKRILAWTIVVISIIGILACTVTVVGSWVINDRMTIRIENMLSGVQGTLSSVENSLTLASTHLNTANTAINTIRETASQFGDNIGENTPILDAIRRAVDEELSPTINTVRDTFLSIWERVLAINNTIETINALPGIQLPTLSTEIQSINDQIQKVTDAVQQLQTYISDLKSGVVSAVIEPLLAKIEPIATFLATLEQDVNKYIGQVNQLQAAVENLQAKISSTIDIFTILLSIALAWVILAQISLILAAGLYLKTGRKVWEFTPGEPTPVEPTPVEP